MMMMMMMMMMMFTAHGITAKARSGHCVISLFGLIWTETSDQSKS